MSSHPLIGYYLFIGDFRLDHEIKNFQGLNIKEYFYAVSIHTLMNEILALGVVILLLIIALIILVILYQRQISVFRINLEKERAVVNEKALETANKIFEKWSQTTLEGMKGQITESVRKEFEAKLEGWKIQEEEKIRKDAVLKSVNTLLGKIGEEFSPVLLSGRFGINLKDFRHLGTPVDYVAFRGLSDDKEIAEVIFLEIKSGKSSNLVGRERKVRDAVDQGRVRYEVVNLSEIINEGKDQLKLQ